MGKATTADKIIGTLLLLCGVCGLAQFGYGFATAQGKAAMSGQGTFEMAASIVAVIACLLGGIGLWLGARWGHIIVIVGAVAGVVSGVKTILVPPHFTEQQAAAMQGGAELAAKMTLIFAAVGVVVWLALGAYAAWRLVSDKP